MIRLLKKIWHPWIERITTDSLKPHIWRLHCVDWPFRFYVHRIQRPDLDRYMHNHPRPFISVVLWGGYTETTYTPGPLAVAHRRSYRRGSFNHMSVRRFHRIISVEPHTVTLLLGRYRKEPGDWGFLTPDGVVPYEDWVNHPDRRVR